MGYLALWIVSWVVFGICLYRASRRKSLTIGIGGGFIASLLFLIFVFAIWPIQSAQQKAASEAAKAVASAEDACYENWRACKDNAMLVNHSDIHADAVVACKDEADREAKYGHPDFPFIAFGTFYKGDGYLKSGVMVLEEPDATFQNGFGAMARATVTCAYDMKKRTVVDMAIVSH